MSASPSRNARASSSVPLSVRPAFSPRRAARWIGGPSAIGIAERKAQFDDVGPGGRQAAQDLQRLVARGVTGHDIGHEAGPALGLQAGEAGVDTGGCHGVGVAAARFRSADIAGDGREAEIARRFRSGRTRGVVEGDHLQAVTAAALAALDEDHAVLLAGRRQPALASEMFAVGVGQGPDPGQRARSGNRRGPAI